MNFADLIREHFPDVVCEGFELAHLPGERDINVKVTSSQTTAVLKISAPKNREWLALQDRALRQLPGLHVPRPLHRHLVEIADGRIARLVTWIEGSPWADITPTQGQLTGLGRIIGSVDRELARLDLTPAEREVLDRPFRWNMMQADDLAGSLDLLADGEIKETCAQVLAEFISEVRPRLARLPGQMIHNDANEHNIIVSGEQVGLIDFGDVIWAPRVVGLATALAYAGASFSDPIPALLPIVRAYHIANPLTPLELTLLLVLMRLRLVMSIINAAVQSAADPGNEYLVISQDAVPALLIRLQQVNEYLALCRFRDACGYEPSPGSISIRRHLSTASSADVVAPPRGSRTARFVDWSQLGSSPVTATAIDELMTDVDMLVGHYCEDRDVYRGAAFEPGTAAARTVHLGIDLFQPAGSPVFALFPGVIEAFEDRQEQHDYGPVLVLGHVTDDGVPFFTLYGHLSRQSLATWQIGRVVAAGEQIATIGSEDANGGWPPHVHLQVLADLCGMGTAVFGVAPRGQVPLWRSISPNPNLALGLLPGSDAHAPLPSAGVGDQRAVRLSPNLSLNYRQPLHIVRGEGAYLFDADGRRYLDLVNNVAHVGHSNPYVIEMAARQMATLNTNTRYLHNAILEYARSLASTLPDPLSVVFLVNSGSEANDLAIRMARAHTGARGWVSLRHAYHGHTASVVDISPYKFLGRGGEGMQPNVRVAELPDPFRGRHRGPGAGAAYAADFGRTLATLDQPLAAFIAEGIVSTAGQVTLADGFLAAAYQQTRDAGGLCIADEVQIGLGRVGDRFWGFELHGVVPDIVTMGKPLGAGHPLAAVVTTPEVAFSFNNGMEYFNTFGGNPVSAVIGQAVLDYVYDARLQANATDVGGYLREQVRAMAGSHPLIADVRGAGLFIGVELMHEDASPATAEVAEIIEFAKDHGVLLSSDGPDNNVFKIKPPMVLTRSDVDRFLDVLDKGLTRHSRGDHAS